MVVGVLDILGAGADDLFRTLDHLLAPLTRDVLTRAFDRDINPRALAVAETTEKVLSARARTGAPPFEEVMGALKRQLNL